MQYPVLQWAYLVLGWGLGATLFFACWRVRLFHLLPFFFAYATWQVVQTPVATFIGSRYGFASTKYGLSYWGLATIDWGLVFLLILELYDRSLHVYPGLRRFFRMAIISGAALTMGPVIASLVAAQIIDVPYQWVNNWCYLLARSVWLVRGGLLLALIVFLKWFRLPVSRLLRYLMLGWLLICALELALTALRYEFGSRFYGILVHAQPLTYILTDSFLLWTVWRWGAEEQPQPAFVMVRDDRRQLVLNRLESITSALRR